jgi:hypothetical protein
MLMTPSSPRRWSIQVCKKNSGTTVRSWWDSSDHCGHSASSRSSEPLVMAAASAGQHAHVQWFYSPKYFSAIWMPSSYIFWNFSLN